MSPSIDKIFQSNTNLDISSSFIDTMFHELKKPLQPLIGFSEVLLEEISLDTSPDLYFAAKRILSSTELLEDFIRQLSTYFKTLNLEKKEENHTDLNSLFSELKEEFQPQLEKSQGELNIRPSLPKIRGDSSVYKILFQNLIKNSIQYSIAAPKIVISGTQTGGFLDLELLDNGMGFSEEDLENLFKPFYRGHASKKTNGIGLGLPICQHIIKANELEIGVQSIPNQETKILIKKLKIQKNATL